MATLNQIVSNIKNVPSGGFTPADFPFTDAQIAHWVDYHSTSLRVMDTNDKGYVDNTNVQDLGCQTLTKVDAADCALLEWGTDVKYVDVPNTLQLRKMNPIVFFGKVDKVSLIPFKDADIVPLDKYIRFPKPIGMSASIIGNRIYLRGANSLGLCYVNIRGVFQTPSIVTNCPKEGDTPICYDWDCQYPICEYLLTMWLNSRGQPMQGLYERIWQTEMGLGLKGNAFAKQDKEENPV